MPKKKQNMKGASRTHFKQTAAYIKPRDVAPGEKAGSKYRQKLRARQMAARAEMQ